MQQGQQEQGVVFEFAQDPSPKIMGYDEPPRFNPIFLVERIWNWLISSRFAHNYYQGIFIYPSKKSILVPKWTLWALISLTTERRWRRSLCYSRFQPLAQGAQLQDSFQSPPLYCYNKCSIQSSNHPTRFSTYSFPLLVSSYSSGQEVCVQYVLLQPYLEKFLGLMSSTFFSHY